MKRYIQRDCYSSLSLLCPPLYRKDEVAMMSVHAFTTIKTMNEKDRFSLISPLDHRYYFANKQLFETLQQYVSEDAAVRYYIEVELSLLETLRTYFDIDEWDVEAARENAKHIETEEVYAEEGKTKHNIRAVVNVLKRHVPSGVAPYIHLGATSFDITDTAWALRLRDVSTHVVIPTLGAVQKELIRLAETHMETPQVGRTHGQYAVPITLGHTFAEYISRLGGSIEEITARIQCLTGKLSGAVGAYNGLRLIAADPLEVEKQHMKRLGLIPAEYSSQIAAPEAQLRLLLEYNTAFGILANLADDLRNLQRSEIGEVYEHFDADQVGSSTMPQKRNPWNSEHIKSLYKAYAPRVMTFYLDQISEHQRDLTNSASVRFVVEYIAGFTAAAERMKTVLKGLKVDEKRVQQNIARAGEALYAEALYIVLALEGENNGHEIVRNAVLDAEKQNSTLLAILQKQPKVWNALETRLAKLQLPPAHEFLSNPAHYTGCAVARSTRIVAKYKKL